MSDLIDRQAVIDVLAAMQGRCTSKAALIQNSKIWQQVKDLPSAQPEQLGTNLAEVGTEPTNIVKNCNDKPSGSDDYSYKSAEVGTEQKYDPFVWNDNTDGLIDRAHLLKRLQDFVEWCRDDRLDGTKFCIDVIKDEPSAQPERDIPIKPTEATDRAWGIPTRQAVCPKCDYYLGHVAFLGDYKGKRITYCETCGQAIDYATVRRYV